MEKNAIVFKLILVLFFAVLAVIFFTANEWTTEQGLKFEAEHYCQAINNSYLSNFDFNGTQYVICKIDDKSFRLWSLTLNQSKIITCNYSNICSFFH